MEGDIAKYRDEGSVEVLRANLEAPVHPGGAEVRRQGPEDFADITEFEDDPGGKIYGIEPGNDGNRLIWT